MKFYKLQNCPNSGTEHAAETWVYTDRQPFCCPGCGWAGHGNISPKWVSSDYADVSIEWKDGTKNVGSVE